MATKANYKISEIGLNKVGFSKTRSIIETAFYGNNVVEVKDLKTAYELAKNSPGTIITDMDIYKAKELGLSEDAKVLLFNDGAITGRYATARRIANEPGVDVTELDKIAMDAIYKSRFKKMYHASAYVGLDKEFMVKAHLLIPEGEENILYNWLLNFQYISKEYEEMYKDSTLISDGKEADIYIFSDPTWAGSDSPTINLDALSDPEKKTLCYFNTETNVACILGMKYFGEHKKGTLTMAWAIAKRAEYAVCHGGQKRYNLENNKTYVASVFGLSGSGKSTITHAKHGGKYDITVLHDDAFIINSNTGSSIALEPSYFDKTSDYPTGSEDNKFLLSVQNVGATKDVEGKIQIVTEDIRNGNGRAIKSKLWSDNRVDKIKESVDAIFWIMKDPTLPPVLKINTSSLAALMGATLATKRTSAERLAKGVDKDALVVVPYANPFRTYPLKEDYKVFKKLIEEKNVACYIINTGDFMGKDIKAKDTLSILENIVEQRAEFKKWGSFSDIEIMEIEGFVPDMKDKEYLASLKARMEDRLKFVKSLDEFKQGYDKLPEDATLAIERVLKEI